MPNPLPWNTHSFEETIFFKEIKLCRNSWLPWLYYYIRCVLITVDCGLNKIHYKLFLIDFSPSESILNANGWCYYRKTLNPFLFLKWIIQNLCHFCQHLQLIKRRPGILIPGLRISKLLYWISLSLRWTIYLPDAVVYSHLFRC